MPYQDVGPAPEGVSPTEREFNCATELEKHRLIFVKGPEEGDRHPRMYALIARAQGAAVPLAGGLPEPDFEVGAGFLIRIWRSGDGKTTQRRQKTARKNPQSAEPPALSDRILALLNQNPSASRREIAATLGTTGSTVRYRLDKLRASGRIERVGPDKGGYWRVLAGSPDEPDPLAGPDLRSRR